MSLHRFYRSVWALAVVEELRIGQALFNRLFEVRPDLAESLRATRIDPFFCDTVTDSRWDAAIDFIERNWYSDRVLLCEIPQE